jgi:hypothetical protein
LYYKQNEVLNHLQRIGKVEPEFEPILGSEKTVFSTETKWSFRFLTAVG